MALWPAQVRPRKQKGYQRSYGKDDQKRCSVVIRTYSTDWRTHSQRSFSLFIRKHNPNRYFHILSHYFDNFSLFRGGQTITVDWNSSENSIDIFGDIEPASAHYFGSNNRLDGKVLALRRVFLGKVFVVRSLHDSIRVYHTANNLPLWWDQDKIFQGLPKGRVSQTQGYRPGVNFLLGYLRWIDRFAVGWKGLVGVCILRSVHIVADSFIDLEKDLPLLDDNWILLCYDGLPDVFGQFLAIVLVWATNLEVNRDFLGDIVGSVYIGKCGSKVRNRNITSEPSIVLGVEEHINGRPGVSKVHIGTYRHVACQPQVIYIQSYVNYFITSSQQNNHLSLTVINCYQIIN